MSSSVVKRLFHQFFLIVNLSHRCDGKTAQMRLNQKRLRLTIRNTTDSKIAGQFLHIPLELCPKRRIFNIVDRTVKSFLFAVHSHAAPTGSQMGMIINTEKQVKYTALF